MKELNQSLAMSGYSQEEVYFFEHNKKLIENLREKRARRFDIARKLEEAREKLHQQQCVQASD